MIKSVYKYAAEAGIPAGIYMTVMSSCFLLSNSFPSLPLLLPVLFLMFPYLLWRMMKKMIRLQPSYQKFSTLWLFGIYVIIFGTLISSFFSGVYLTFINPGFINEYVNQAIASIESLPDPTPYAASAEVMKRAIEDHLLPSGMEFVAATGWSSCFFGSILSMILSLFLAHRRADSIGAWR